MLSVEVSVNRWAAWLSGISSEKDIKAWAEGRMDADLTQAPDMGFLPPKQRRRLSLLSKMVLYVAHHCCDDEKIATVYCSRYGEFTRTVTLLKDLAAKEPLSPTTFSQSVHNTASGLVSIMSKNREPATAISACEDTLPTGFIESASMLLSGRQEKVLLIMADEIPPPPYHALSESGIPYAMALLLTMKNGKRNLKLETGKNPSEENPVGQYGPDFLRFFFKSEKTFTKIGSRHQWFWEKRGLWN